MQLPPVDRSIPPPAAAESTPGVGAVASAQSVRTGVTQAAQDTKDSAGTLLGTLGTQSTQGTGDPEKSSSAADTPNRDWTTVQKKEKPAQVPPPEPIYKMLMDHIQSMWRASTQAVDIAAEAQRQAMQHTGSQNTFQTGPLVYTDPSKVKRPPSSSSV